MDNEVKTYWEDKTILQIRKEIASLHKYLQDTSSSWVVQSPNDFANADKLLLLKEILEVKENSIGYVIKDKIRNKYYWGMYRGIYDEWTPKRETSIAFTYKQAEEIVNKYYKPKHLSILKAPLINIARGEVLGSDEMRRGVVENCFKGMKGRD